MTQSASSQHLEKGRGRPVLSALAACLFGLSASLFLGRFELHTDDTGVEVFLILVYTFILGCWYPKWAWLTPLLSLSIPLAEWAWGHPHGSLNQPGALVVLAAVVTVIGFIGSYAGVLIRKVVIDKVLR